MEQRSDNKRTSDSEKSSQRSCLGGGSLILSREGMVAC